MKGIIKNIFLHILVLYSSALFAQQGILKGRVTDAETRQALPFANIILQGTSIGATTDQEGNFLIQGISPNLYNITVSTIGYEQQTLLEIQISSSRTTVANFELKPLTVKLSEVEISSNRFEKSEESPVSKISIRAAEIMRNPGGNRDISRVLQSFPGVASTVSFRNDIIIRGGAPNENRFYLDGIEVPNINHFSTQGSSGGPVGLINVNFIDQVEFYSGAFPAARGNALSSVLEIKQKSGNPDRMVTSMVLGSSDIGLTLDGPLSVKSDYIFSIRKSYLKFLFSTLKLPFLPTYNDGQLKLNYYLDNNNSLTLVAIGAIDEFRLNEKVNEKVKDSITLERNKYILGYTPVNEQWNYTAGIKYTHKGTSGIQNLIASRNTLNNTSTKYYNNDQSSPVNLILDYKSEETENKFRLENIYRKNTWKLSYGLNYEHAFYSNRTYNKLFIPAGIITVNYKSELRMNKAGMFVQLSRPLFKNKLMLSAGVRTDVNDYSKEMSNIASQFSPRFAASLQINEKWSWNFNTGKYFQLPAYTVLGYRNNEGELVNKTKVKYIESDHFVSGIEFVPDQSSKISVEGFYKLYSKYPLLVNEKISLANLGSDFGVIGNAPVESISKGRSYGAELLMQRSLKKGLYGIIAYTLVRSEFTNGSENYAPSSWDNKHILTITGGKQFIKNWEIGLKFRYFSGAPYTPYNLSQTSLKQVYDITRTGIPDYSNINSLRLGPTHQLDIRIDKKYFIKNKALNFYMDVQNIYNSKTKLAPYITTVNFPDNTPVTDPADPSRYLLREIENENGTVLPSIGIMVEF